MSWPNIAEIMAHGAAKERAAIVAWLREPKESTGVWLSDMAARIERGEHLNPIRMTECTCGATRVCEVHDGPYCTATEHAGKCYLAKPASANESECSARSPDDDVCDLPAGHVGDHRARIEMTWPESSSMKQAERGDK